MKYTLRYYNGDRVEVGDYVLAKWRYQEKVDGTLHRVTGMVIDPDNPPDSHYDREEGIMQPQERFIHVVDEAGFYYPMEPHEVQGKTDNLPASALEPVTPLDTPRAFQRVFEILAKERDIGTPPARTAIQYLIGTADRIGLEVFGIGEAAEEEGYQGIDSKISVNWR
jgi:hypothetical protein